MSINTQFINIFDDGLKSILFNIQNNKEEDRSEVLNEKIESYENKLRNLLDLIENFSKSESFDMNYFIKKTFSEVDFADFFNLIEIYIQLDELIKAEFNLKNIVQIIDKSIGNGIFQKGSQFFEIQFLSYSKLVTIEIKKKDRCYSSLKSILDSIYDLIKETDEINSKNISNSSFANDTLNNHVSVFNEIPLLKTYFIHWYLLLFYLSKNDSYLILLTAEELINLLIKDVSFINLIAYRQNLLSYISFSAILVGSMNKSSNRKFLNQTINLVSENDYLSLLLKELLSSNNYDDLLDLKNKSKEIIINNPLLKSTISVFDLSINRSILKNMIFLNSEIEVDYVKRLFSLDDWNIDKTIGFISDIISLFNFEVEILVSDDKRKVEFKTGSNWFYESEKDSSDLRKFRLMTENMKSYFIVKNKN